MGIKALSGGTSAAEPRPDAARSHARRRLCVVFVVSAVMALFVAAPGSQLESAGADTATTIDRNSRQAVIDAYRNWLSPALATPIGWTGSVAGCNAGTTSAQAEAATLSAINYFRAMAGLPPVTLDASLSAPAQQAALMMSANNDLSHNPPSDWTCWTQSGASSAGGSNIALGAGGAEAIELYIADPGASNAAAGHRRWILRPTTASMGTGSTSNANALTVIGGAQAARPDPLQLVTWPSAGWFPSELEPNGRWSASRFGSNLSGATVTVTDTSTGAQLPVSINPWAPGYGDDTLVFEVGGVDRSGAEKTYRVRLDGVVTGGSTHSIEWTTTLFGASPPPPPPPPPPPSVLPVGSLEAVEVHGRRVTFRGWAADGNMPEGFLPIVVGGAGREAWGQAWAWRPDVAAVTGLSPNSGFAASIDLPPGSHRVCIAAIDYMNGVATGGFTQFGCTTVTVK